MAKHEWRERGDDGLRFYRAEHHSRHWKISSRLKDEEEWTDHEPINNELWRQLRDVLWRKYQRKRCPWEHVDQIDKILEGGGESGGLRIVDPADR